MIERPALVVALVVVTGCATVGDTPGPPPPGAVTAEVQTPPMGTKWTVKETAFNENTGKTESSATTLTLMGQGVHQGKPVTHVWDGANIQVHDRSTHSWMAVLDKDSREIVAHEPHDGQFSQPLWVGKSWTARFTRHERIRGRSFYDVVFVWTVKAYEDVQVPAGTFKAFRVEAWPDHRDPVKKRTYWYAPDVKLVVKDVTEGYGRPHDIGVGRDRMRHTLELVEYVVPQAGTAGRAALPRSVLGTPTTVPVDVVGNLTLVSVIVNGSQQSLMLVDTGATSTLITPQQLARLGLTIPANAPRRLVTVVGGRKVEVPYVRLSALQVGDASVEDLEVGVTAIAPDAPMIGGLLGGDFLQRFTVTIDTTTRSMRLAPRAETASGVLPREPAALVEMLRTDPSAGRRHVAAVALGGIPASSPDVATVVTALLDALRDPDQPVQHAAAAALIRLGETLVPALTQDLAAADAEQRRKSAALLRSIAPFEPVLTAPVMVRALTDDDAEVRTTAVRSLAEISAGEHGMSFTVRKAVQTALQASPAGVAAVAELVRAREVEVRVAALWLLGQAGPSARSAGSLVVATLTNDIDGRARATAAEALRSIGPTDGDVHALLAALRDADAHVREYAAYAARPRVAEFLPALETDVHATDVEVRRKAVEALRWLAPAAPERVIPLLASALEDTEPGVRLASAGALAAGGEGALPVMRAAMRHRDPAVRAGAARAVGELGFRAVDALPALVEALKDPAASVRASVARALGVIGSDAAPAVPALRALAQDDPVAAVRSAAEAAARNIAGQ